MRFLKPGNEGALELKENQNQGSGGHKDLMLALCKWIKEGHQAGRI